MDPQQNERLTRLENAVMGNGRPGLIEINGRVHEALKVLQEGQKDILDELKSIRETQQADRVAANEAREADAQKQEQIIADHDRRIAAQEQWSGWQKGAIGLLAAALAAGIVERLL